MNSCRESIVNNESIKENTGGRPDSLVSCRYGYGILGKMVCYDQHIDDTTTSIFQGQIIKGNHLHWLAGDDIFEWSTMW